MTDDQKPLEQPTTPAPARVERVTVSEVITDSSDQKVRNKFRRIINGVNLRSALRIANDEVILPSIREILFDSLKNIGENVIFGGRDQRRGGHRPARRYGGSLFDDPRDYRPRYQYSTSTRRNMPDQRPSYSRTTRRYDDFREITFTSRIDAERVLEELLNGIERYGVASVADFYDAAGLPPVPTDNKWGWLSLRRADVYQTPDGYKIDLPVAEPI